MKHHSEKANPASKSSTKSMLNAGLKRGGDPAYDDQKPSDKLTRQSLEHVAEPTRNMRIALINPCHETTNPREATGQDRSTAADSTETVCSPVIKLRKAKESQHYGCCNVAVFTANLSRLIEAK